MEEEVAKDGTDGNDIEEKDDEEMKEDAPEEDRNKGPEKPTEMEEEKDIVQIVEAVLFSAGRPLTVPEIERSTGRDRKDIRKAVKKVRRMYRNRKTALEVAKIGRKYSLQLNETYNEYGMKMMDKDLSKPILKTAALIAYLQPIKQSELKKKVGDQVYSHVEKLDEIGLILTEQDGRTYSLRTSPKFQEYFGLSAKDRNELKKLMAERANLDRK